MSNSIAICWGVWLAFMTVVFFVLRGASKTWSQKWRGYYLHAFVAILLVGSCALFFWLKEDEYSAKEKASWSVREYKLQNSSRWIAFSNSWKDLGEACYQLSNVGSTEGVSGLDAKELELRRDELQKATRVADGRLDALGPDDIVDSERRALKQLIFDRVLLAQGQRPAGSADVAKSWTEQVKIIEDRCRLLSLVEPGKETTDVLWQQRVRMAKDIFCYAQMRPFELGSTGSLSTYVAILPSEAEHIPFASADPISRSLGLLLVSLGCYRTPQEASGQV